MSHNTCRLSIVLSTYNRCEMLGPALDRLLAQSPDSLPYELIVVDNNSSDDTPAVVESRIERSDGRVRYIFEPRQGLSDARNAGLRAVCGDLVAFTDDDVRVSEGWVSAIIRAFDGHEEVDCLGGRTLPMWPSPPPPWLTPLHWVGPLALQDYGEHLVAIDARRPLSLAGANLAFRMKVFDRIGLFSPDFPRSEDTELLLRFWLEGLRALYVPDMLIHAEVQPERLTKTYHRQWHTNIGRCNARMAFEEMVDPIYGLRPPRKLRRIYGVPTFAIRQATVQLCQWLAHRVFGSEAQAFLHETSLRRLVGYIRENRSMSQAAKADHPARPEVVGRATVAVSPRDLS
jgi:glycosyltransferase involved in cell wall biosynthesis